MTGNNIGIYNAELDVDAGLWAQELRLGGTLFKSLPIGARFVFSKDHADKPYAILIKTRRGYRHEIGGRQFTTGARTATFRLPPV